MKKPETRFKEKCKRDLVLLSNLWYFKTQEVTLRGIPDFVMCLNGFFIAIELKKSESDKADELQTYTLKRIQTKGKGLSFLASPENWKGILEILNNIDSIPEHKLVLRKLLSSARE